MFCLSLTPLVEPFTDTNGNDVYDYSEPFEDLNGNGEFDPVWMGGFAPGRLAHGVRDSLPPRAPAVRGPREGLLMPKSEVHATGKVVVIKGSAGVEIDRGVVWYPDQDLEDFEGETVKVTIKRVGPPAEPRVMGFQVPAKRRRRR